MSVTDNAHRSPCKCAVVYILKFDFALFDLLSLWRPGLDWGDPTDSQIWHLFFEIHYL